MGPVLALSPFFGYLRLNDDTPDDCQNFRYKKKVEGDPSTERQSLTLRDVELSVSTKRFPHLFIN